MGTEEYGSINNSNGTGPNNNHEHSTNVITSGIKQLIEKKVITKILTIVTVLFCTMELLGCFYLWFDLTGGAAGPNVLAVGNFEGWMVATTTGEDSIVDELTFFSYYVGNNKFIMACMLLTTCFSNDARTKQLGGMFATIGCILYYWKMAPLMSEMVSNEEAPTAMAQQTYYLILLFIAILGTATTLYSIIVF